MVLLLPPGASARPRVSRCPLPDSPTNVRSSTQVMRAFMFSSPSLETVLSLSPQRRGLQCGLLGDDHAHHPGETRGVLRRGEGDAGGEAGGRDAVDAVAVHDRDCWSPESTLEN